MAVHTAYWSDQEVLSLDNQEVQVQAGDILNIRDFDGTGIWQRVYVEQVADDGEIVFYILWESCRSIGIHLA